MNILGRFLSAEILVDDRIVVPLQFSPVKRDPFLVCRLQTGPYRQSWTS